MFRRFTRWGLTLATLAVLSACMTVPQSRPCTTAEACLVSEIIATDMGKDIGKDFGGGVLLSNVQAAGSLVVVDIQMPLPVANLETVQKRALHEVNVQSFVAGFCRPMLEEGAEDIFQFGNAFQVRTVGSDGALAGASTIESCGA